VVNVGTRPAVLDGTDDVVGSPLPDDGAVTPCASCVHLAAGHDATSLRWCAATADSHLDRRCICLPGAVVAPVDRVLLEPAATGTDGTGTASASPKNATPANHLRSSYANRLREFSGDRDLAPGLTGRLNAAAVALDLLAEGLYEAAARPKLTAAQRFHLGRLLDQLR